MTHYEASKPRAIRTDDAITKIAGRPKQPLADKVENYGRIILLGLVLALAAAELADITGVPDTPYDATQALTGP
jgi:hypothetical protein